MSFASESTAAPLAGKTLKGKTLEGKTLRLDWASQGSCLGRHPDDLFVSGAAQQTAKIVCQRCPVIAECLAEALDNRTEFGVWGGMTERERRALLRQNPHITSWWALFSRRAATHRQPAAS